MKLRLDQMEANLPPIPSLPPCPPVLFSALPASPRSSSFGTLSPAALSGTIRTQPLDDVTELVLLTLKVPLGDVHLLPLAMSTNPLENDRTSLPPLTIPYVTTTSYTPPEEHRDGPEVLHAASSCVAKYFDPEAPCHVSNSPSNTNYNAQRPIQTAPCITPLLLSFIPSNTSIVTVDLLASLQSLLALHPIMHFPTFSARVKLHCGGDVRPSSPSVPSMSFFAAMTIALALGGLAFKAPSRSNDGGGSGLTDAEIMRLFYISEQALTFSYDVESASRIGSGIIASGGISPTLLSPPIPIPGPNQDSHSRRNAYPPASAATMPTAASVLDTQTRAAMTQCQFDQLIAGLLQLVFLLHLPALHSAKDGTESIMEGGALDEKHLDKIGRVMASVGTVARRLGVMIDPFTGTANGGDAAAGRMSVWEREERRRLGCAVLFYEL